jgi:hypothetical protein
MRFSFSIRSLFVLTGLVAVVLWAWITIQHRRSEFSRRALQHWREANYSVTLEVCTSPTSDLEAKRFYTQHDAYQAHHSQMYDKYLYAAHHPWLPVKADPVSLLKP